jgi:hypothetical protein
VIAQGQVTSQLTLQQQNFLGFPVAVVVLDQRQATASPGAAWAAQLKTVSSDSF